MPGRRKARIDDASAWVFNRIANVYAARPPYPDDLLDALVALAGGAGSRVLDLGAGIGHLALPLSARGLRVTAVEPAGAMLAELGVRARAAGLSVECQLATAEAFPAQAGSADLVVIADALHFLDAALTGAVVARALGARGALAIVQCELGQTPFMRELVAIMEESAPRRPRAVASNTRELAARAGVALGEPIVFDDARRVDHETLERILRSISFIGPAMNQERFRAFRTRVRALSDEPVWARRITLQAGRRA